jgi:hypothetical protein
MSNPSLEHFKVVDGIFSYLNKYPNLNILYKGIDLYMAVIKAYNDLNWGNYLDFRRLITGYLITINNNFIGWGVYL